MKALQAFTLALGLVLCLSLGVFAEDSWSGDRPNRYKPIDAKVLKEHVRRMKSGAVSRTDMNALTSQIHNVSVLAVPTRKADIIPASTRPEGSLQLERVVTIIDPR